MRYIYLILFLTFQSNCGSDSSSPTLNSISGCMDIEACNYNPDATIDSTPHSCWEPNEGCVCDNGENAILDCNGNCGGLVQDDDEDGICDDVDDCVGEYDCANICNGNAVVDCNGECGGGAFMDGCQVCSGGNTGIEINECACSLDPNTIGFFPKNDGSVYGYIAYNIISDITEFEFNMTNMNFTPWNGNAFPSSNNPEAFPLAPHTNFLLGGDVAMNEFICDHDPDGSTTNISYLECWGEQNNIIEAGCGILMNIHYENDFTFYTACDCTAADDDEGGTTCSDAANATAADCVTSGGTPESSDEVEIENISFNDGSLVIDVEDTCLNDDYGCLGICGGDSIIDECNICNGPGLDCNNECASAVEDECGVCGGDGPANNFDCEGNCVVDTDCLGVCGGSAVLDCNNECEGNSIIDADGTCCPNIILFDECDICNGNNDCYYECDDCGVCDNDPWNNNTTCVQDCNGDWNGTAIEDDCGICDGDGSSCNGGYSNACSLPINGLYLTDGGELWYNVNTDIAGFQFLIDDNVIATASGGDAFDVGFTINYSITGDDTTVLAFSFSGSTIPSGCGTLVNLTAVNSTTILSTLVFSDSTGNGFEVTLY